MTDQPKPKPVAILFEPRFYNGEPACRKCPIRDVDFRCLVNRDTYRKGSFEPGPQCPVHGPPEVRREVF